MFERILVPVDGSKASGRATLVAAEIAARFEAEVVVFHASEHDYLYGVEMIGTGLEEAREYVDRHVRRLKDVGLSARGEIVETQHGGAARAILEAIEDEGAEIVVMGRHGHSAMGRLLMGSVADKVVHLAECPVLLVR